MSLSQYILNSKYQLTMTGISNFCPKISWKCHSNWLNFNQTGLLFGHVPSCFFLRFSKTLDCSKYTHSFHIKTGDESHCIPRIIDGIYRLFFILFCSSFTKLEIKPAIRDVEAFWYQTEIKIIYFVPLCLIVFDCMVYPDRKFLIFKTKKRPNFFSGVTGCFFWSYIITHGICNKFIKMKISVGCTV